MSITIYTFLKGYTIAELISVFREVQPVYLLAGVGMMFLYFFCQAINYSMILRVLEQPCTVVRGLEYAYIGFYFGSITPSASGAQPAQMYYMNKDKITVAHSSIMIFFAVFVYQITMILLAGILSLLRPTIAIHFIDKFKYLLILGSIVTIGLILILTIIMFSEKIVHIVIKLSFILIKKMRFLKKQEELEEKFAQLMISYHEKSKIIRLHPVLFFKSLGVSIIQFASTSTVSYLVYRSLGYHKYDALDLITSQVLMNISVTAVPLPGSVGVAEKGFLSVFGIFYPSDILPSAMLLSRGINFYLPLIISFIMYLVVHFRIIKQKKLIKEK
jgi:uncharacterized protein (TIRG00374 family)